MSACARILPAATAALLVVALAACGAKDDAEPTGAARASGAGAGPGSPTASLSATESARLRELGLRYWEVFNAYDLEGALALLEPGYAESRRAELESDISQVEWFNVTLEIGVLQEPRLTDEDTAEMALRMKTPIDVRRILMRFARSGTDWWITFAEQQE